MNDLLNARRTGAHRLAPHARGFAALVIVAVTLTGCTLTDLFGVQTVEDSSTVGSAPTVASVPPAAGDLLQVDAVEVLILESFPIQVNVVVQGTVPDACTEIGQVSQQRLDNEIVITVTTTRDPNAFCAQVLTPVEETIAIPGDFPPGTYTVTVNGVVEPFRI